MRDTARPPGTDGATLRVGTMRGEKSVDGRGIASQPFSRQGVLARSAARMALELGDRFNV